MATRPVTKKVLAQHLCIARSSLYYQPKQAALDEAAKAKIRAVMAEHPAYGHRRLALALEINHKKASRLMSKYQLKPQIQRRGQPDKPDDLGRSETQVANILTVLCPIRPNVIWAGDFTYFWYEDRFWYLATVLDLYVREVVGWHLANHHTTALISEAFQDALRRTRAAPRYFHSDQGSGYVSGGYARLLATQGTRPSHARKSSPWQNGCQESFYSNFKLELGDVRRFQDVGQLIEAVGQQIAYYNNRRIHLTLKMPPLLFKQTYYKKQLAYASL